jgi:lipopolysaccharide biosynthesis glycosyltransferase
MRVLFVTAANEPYAELLRELVQSLHAWDRPLHTALACFDLGLDAASRQWIGQYAEHIVTPGWDLAVSEHIRATQSHLRALTARPFLRDYFPGYDMYLWIDSDCWVQEQEALKWYIAAASHGAMAITPEVHHAYIQRQAIHQWRADRLRACFGPDIAQQLNWNPYFNAGVFALRDNAPHWALWRQAFEHGLEATQGRVCCDQTALNHMLWTHGGPVNPLSATCNWLCHLRAPGYDVDRQRFCEPTALWHPLGILHLVADTKSLAVQVRDKEGIHNIPVRFATTRSIGSKKTGSQKKVHSDP